MIGLVIQLARLCIAVLTLITRVLAFLVEQTTATLARHASAAQRRSHPDAATWHGPAPQPRRRAYTAPPRRARRSFR